tara:strand:+ start:24251 stop:24457 length:207 start_codon:yes stop_codon:yes gene_type:complete
MKLFNNIAEVTDEEFSWSKYQARIINSKIEQYKSKENAIVEMNALIGSLKVEISALQEMITWNDEEEE